MSEEAQQGIKPSIPTICSRNKISTLSDRINLSRENSIFKSVAETIAWSANQRGATGIIDFPCLWLSARRKMIGRPGGE